LDNHDQSAPASNFLLTLSSSRLGRWGAKGLIAVVDQGLFSGTNFLVGILMARWLVPDDFGAYSLAFSIFLFLAGFQNAIIIEPMSVIGPSQYTNRLVQYLKAQISIHWVFVTAEGLLLVCAGIVIYFASGALTLSGALIGMGLAISLTLLLWLVRRGFYMLQKPFAAMISTVIYSLVMLASVWCLHRLSLVTAFSVYLTTGVASSIAAGIILYWVFRRSQGAPIPPNQLLPEQWAYGKWIMAASVFSLTASQAPIFLSVGIINIESAGIVRAIQNFIQPMIQVITAIAVLGIPVLASDFGQGRLASLRRKGYFMIAVLTGIAGLYAIGLWTAKDPLEQLLYSGKFSEFRWLIPWAGIVPILSGIEMGFAVMLRAIQKPQYFLICGLGTALVGIVTGLIFISLYGIAGAIISMILTGFVSLLITIILFFLWFPKTA
jgi:O-antigen/teichoic acid export membrane protein